MSKDEPTPGTTDEAMRDDEATGLADASDDAADGSDSGNASDDVETLRRRAEEAERKAAQLLSERTRVEEESRRLQAERERMSSATGNTREQVEAQAELQRLLRLEQEAIAGLGSTQEHFIAVSRLNMMRAADLERRRAEDARRAELYAISDEAERQLVERVANEEGVSLRAARRIVKAEREAGAKKQAEHETEAERERRLATAAALRDSAPATSSTRAMNTQDTQKRMDQQEYARRMAKLDPNDPEQFEQRKRLKRQFERAG